MAINKKHIQHFLLGSPNYVVITVVFGVFFYVMPSVECMGWVKGNGAPIRRRTSSVPRSAVTLAEGENADCSRHDPHLHSAGSEVPICSVHPYLQATSHLVLFGLCLHCAVYNYYKIFSIA